MHPRRPFRERHSLVGAYALGALSAREANAFARHLRWCRRCRDELHRLRGVVDALALLGDDPIGDVPSRDVPIGDVPIGDDPGGDDPSGDRPTDPSATDVPPPALRRRILDHLPEQLPRQR